MKITKAQLTKIIKEELEMFEQSSGEPDVAAAEQNSGEPDVAAALKELAELEDYLLHMGAGANPKDPYAKRGRSNEQIRQAELADHMMPHLRAARVALGADPYME